MLHPLLMLNQSCKLQARKTVYAPPKKDNINPKQIPKY